MAAILIKALKRALMSLALIAALGIFTVLVIAGTEGGASWAIRQALESANEGSETNISIREINGTFLDELSFRELLIASEPGELRVFVDSVRISLNPLALFNSQLAIRNLLIDELVITLPENDGSSQQDQDLEAALSELFVLPLRIRIQEFLVEDTTVTSGAPFSIPSVGGDALLDSNSLILNLDVQLENQASFTSDFRLWPESFEMTAGVDWNAVVGGYAASGELSLGGNIENLEVFHLLAEPVEVTSEGVMETGLFSGETPEFFFQHQVSEVSGQQFNLPVLEQVSGRVSTQGNPEQVGFIINADMQLEALGNVSSGIQAFYSNNQLDISRMSFFSDSFNLSGRGQAVTGDAFALDIEWALSDFSDGDLLPAVVLEEINAGGSLVVAMEGETLFTTLAIESMEGNLNRNSLGGTGNVYVVGSEIQDVSLDLESGANALFLEGSVTPQLNLDWQFDAPELSGLLPALTGSGQGQGQLTGSTENPQIAGRFHAEGLEYLSDGIAINVAVIDADAAYASNSNALSLSFSELEFATSSQSIQQNSGSLRLTGLLDAHDIELNTTGEDLAIDLTANGSVMDSQWQGMLNSAAIDSSYDRWVLQETLPLQLSAGTAVLEMHCWLSEMLQLCGQANWETSNGATGILSLDNLPLAWLNRSIPENTPGFDSVTAVLNLRPAGIEQQQLAHDVFMPENSFIEGEVDISLDFTGLGADWSQASLSAVLVPRELVFGLINAPAPDAESELPAVESYGVDDVQIGINRSNGQWQLQSEFELFLTEAGGLDFQGNFSGDLTLTDDERLGGNFALAFNDIAWVEALVPDFRNVDGELSASGSIDGSLSSPQLLMTAMLSDGGVEIPAYGLNLQDLSLDFLSDVDNELTISGSASSGDGVINIDSRVTSPLQESRAMHLEISGQNFQLINLPESRVVVNPDIEIDYFSNILNINGSLDIPQMEVDLRSSEALAAAGSVDVSRDAVILVNADGSQSTARTAGGLAGQMPVAGTLELHMGENVRFQGYGLDVTLNGDLIVEQSANRPMVAHGELAIPVGSYALYGQQLNVENGKLLFLGNPFNPALDIRAVRQTRVAEVGVLMNGTVRNIQAQLFSTPGLPESEILSLLITGNSFSRAGEFGSQDGENMLGAIALLGLERGQGLTGNIQNRLGLDTVAISSGADYRDSALGLGKYLSPRLFMRYDIGLFDRENVLTLDYTLTERLKLEVETGVSQSVDLTYTVEK